METTIEKLDGTSLNITVEKKNQLRSLFPSVFTESKNEDGELVESIDFEKLKAELGVFSEAFENRRERYNMDWPGKKESLRLIQTPSTATLKPCKEESVNFDTTANLFIEGENLEVLKLLQKSYYGKVKMIYIDPPYNTGKEFIYPDNFSESLETYLKYAGLADEDGKKFSTNTANEGRFHTKWLNMMYPRLYLARNLLKDDGVIFISIDDNEVSNLRKICDEIFGEDNFMSQMIWHSRQNVDSRSLTGVSNDHEYVLCYSKKLGVRIRGKEINKDKYINPDNDPRGDWMSSPMDGVAAKDKRPNLHYTITNPKTGLNYEPSPENGWRFQKSKFEKLLQEKRILWPKNPHSKPRFKRYLNELLNSFTGFSSMINTDYTSKGTKELRELMNNETLKFPKPSTFIKIFIEQALTKNDIVLDFFCGSATTAHAILDLNEKNGSNNKFILVQLPEPCAEDSEAFKAGYKTIADIGKERIRRVINKINKEKEDSLNFTESNQDLGFKVLKLDKSNFKQWQKLSSDTPSEKIAEHLDLYIDHINLDATQEDLLYEILIKAGFTPTEKIETIHLANTSVFSIAEGNLLICLAKKITKELIHEVIKAEPIQFICLDSAFGSDDQFKINIVQTIKDYNMSREKHNQIEFKTI